MADGETAVASYLDAADTRSTLAAVAALGARVDGGRAGGRRHRDRPADRRASGCAAGPRGGDRSRSTSATRAPCCGSCRAGSRGRSAAPGRSTATSRSAAGRWTGSPSRCARWGRRSSAATDGCRRSWSRARRCAGSSTGSGRQRPGEVVPAARRPARRRARRGDRARTDPRPHRAHAAPPPAPRSRASPPGRRSPSAARCPQAITVERGRAAGARRVAIPGDLSSAAFLARRGAARPRQRGPDRGVGLNPTRDRAARDPQPDGGADRGRGGAPVGGEPRGGRARSSGRPASRPASGPGRSRWRSTSCRWSPCRLLRRGRDGRHRRRGAPPQGVGPDRRRRRRARAGSAPRSRRRRRLRGHGDGRPARRHDRLRAATTAWRCSARSRASPRARGSRWRNRGGGGQLPGLRARPRAALTD